MLNLVLALALVVLFALCLLGIAPWYFPPLVIAFCAPGPLRRFLASTARRLWKSIAR